MRVCIFIMGIFFGVFISWSVWAENNFSEKVKKPVREAVGIRQETQKSEEDWMLERQKLLSELERLEEEEQLLQGQRDDLLEITNKAKERVAQKERQLADIAQISTQINPFLKGVLEQLETLISDDMPFLVSERQQRLTRLNRLMEDPQVDVSEKFRKMMEALLIEAEYGNTIEVYQETIAVEDQSILVNIFRLGRISIFYQTLDEKSSGFYDVSLKAWRALPRSYNHGIQTAINIGAKRQPVELLTLPLGRIAGK